MFWTHVTLWAVLVVLSSMVAGIPLIEKDQVAYLTAGMLMMGDIEASKGEFLAGLDNEDSSTTYMTLNNLYILSSPDSAAASTKVPDINLADIPTATLGSLSSSNNAVLSASTGTQTTPKPMRTFTSTVTQVKVVSKTSSSKLEASSTPSNVNYWSLRKDFGKDLSADFSMKTWAWGSTLVTALPTLPTMASVFPVGAQPSAPPNKAPSRNTGRVLQVKYPQGSVNPASTPQGGVGFYASPIDVSRAANVSFGYSVYFPPDFDFVKGGKLPGLYGGHGGCSGGQQSEDCFSTRLMWRKDGMGELYLYAPKDSQTATLCSTPPNSYCDTTYGFSIGRGAWTWKRGQWSDVRQDIWLNTPGKQDGGFSIWINGELVLQNSQVVYRNKSSAKKEQKKVKQGYHNDNADENNDASIVTTSSAGDSAVPTSAIADGGLLGGLLGAVAGSELGALRQRDLVPNNNRDIGSVLTGSRIGLAKVSRPAAQSDASLSVPTSSTKSGFTRHQLAQMKGLRDVWVTPQDEAQQRLGFPATRFAAAQSSSVSFLGMMFDTFFGGSDPSWASPRDQYTYFNMVWMKVNR